MKIALLLLLLMSGQSTPSFAQPCTRDVIASVSNSDDGQIITMVSGAVFRVLPLKTDKYTTVDDLPPWLGGGEHMLICGDHALISMIDNCRVGLNGRGVGLPPLRCRVLAVFAMTTQAGID